MKDPAFLLYSKDFYEGTRTMLPRERACLIDLMIYQHQHGAIPDDMERMTLYCSGIDEATLKATLKAKFRLTDDGWLNDKMEAVTANREEYIKGQSINGRIGQFWKKAKTIVTAKELRDLKSYVYDELGKEKFSQMLLDDKGTLEGLLEGLLKHIINANASIVLGEGGTGETEPTHPLTIWINTNAPTVQKLKNPLTDSEAAELLADLNIDSDIKKTRLKDILMAMENKPDLLKKYKSANLTIRKWWKLEMDRNPITEQTQAKAKRLTIEYGPTA